MVQRYRLPHTQPSKAFERRERKVLREKSHKLDVDAKKREDLSHLNAYAIDRKGTIFCDDAVSFDRDHNRVLVHIADPTAFLHDGRNDPIVRETLKRVETIYLTKGQLPMLTFKLNERRFSLNQKRNRVPALTFGFKIRPDDGSIRNSSITVKPSYVRVTKMSHKEADIAIAKRSNEDLEKLQRVARKMRHNRLPKIASGPRQTNGFQDKRNINASSLVQEFMVATNIAAGSYASRRNIPVLYTKTTSDRGDRRSNTKLSVNPGKHDGVGADAYACVTNPLRDAGSLVSHMQIRSYLRKENYPFSPREMAELSRRRLEPTKNKIKRAEKRVDDECVKRGYLSCKKRR